MKFNIPYISLSLLFITIILMQIGQHFTNDSIDNLISANEYQNEVLESISATPYCVRDARNTCSKIYQSDNEFGVEIEQYNRCKIQLIIDSCSKVECIKYFVPELIRVNKNITLESFREFEIAAYGESYIDQDLELKQCFEKGEAE